MSNPVVLTIRNRSWSGSRDCELRQATRAPLSSAVSVRSTESDEDEYLSFFTTTKPVSSPGASSQRVSTMHLAVLFLLCILVSALVLFQQRWAFATSSASSSTSSSFLPIGSDCRSDDQCGSGNACLFNDDSAPGWRLAPRPTDGKSGWVRVGTCARDTVCTPLSCHGNGKCVLGQCSCDYGFKGDACAESAFAFVSLLYGTSASTKQMLGVITWAKSIRNAGSLAEDIIVAVTPEVPRTVRDELREHGLLVREISPISLPRSMASPFSRERWSKVFSKFMMYGFTEYAKVAVMDTDLVINPQHNPSEIFASCKAEACGVDENWGKMFFKHINGGVMVFKPSLARLDHLQREIPKSRDDFALPEQMWITKYASVERNEMSLGYIDSRWNNCGSRDWSFDEQTVLHFCGPNKPLEMRRISDASKLAELTPDCLPADSGISIVPVAGKVSISRGSSSDSNKLECGWKSYIRSVAAFQDVVVSLDSCFAFSDEASCGNGCNWHGTFCAASTTGGGKGSILSRVAADAGTTGVFSSAELRKLSDKLILV